MPHVTLLHHCHSSRPHILESMARQRHPGTSAGARRPHAGARQAPFAPARPPPARPWLVEFRVRKPPRPARRSRLDPSPEHGRERARPANRPAARATRRPATTGRRPGLRRASWRDLRLLLVRRSSGTRSTGQGLPAGRLVHEKRYPAMATTNNAFLGTGERMTSATGTAALFVRFNEFPAPT